MVFFFDLIVDVCGAGTRPPGIETAVGQHWVLPDDFKATCFVHLGSPVAGRGALSQLTRTYRTNIQTTCSHGGGKAAAVQSFPAVPQSPVRFHLHIGHRKTAQHGVCSSQPTTCVSSREPAYDGAPSPYASPRKDTLHTTVSTLSAVRMCARDTHLCW